MRVLVPQLLSLLALLPVASAFSPSGAQLLSSHSRRSALTPASHNPLLPSALKPAGPPTPINPLTPINPCSPHPLAPLASSYLDSLCEPLSPSAPSPSAPQQGSTEPLSTTAEYLEACSNLEAPPAQSLLRLRGGDSTTAADVTFSHAPLSFFALEKLTPKGLRKGADVGEPSDATRPLASAGPASAGSWSCTAGGWPSPNQRATTEVFYVLTGRGIFTDTDGKKHEFGAGDTVVLPKGWSGRWDILEPIHKVWLVNDHEDIEVPFPIRPVVAPVGEPSAMNTHGSALYGSPESGVNKIYEVGSTSVSFWKCSPGGIRIEGRNSEWLHVLEGTFFLSNPDGTAQRCTAGDTVLMPKGWHGQADIIQTVKAVSVVAFE